MNSFSFWQKWLTWANVLTVGVGLLTAFAGESILFDYYNHQTELVFFDGQPLAPEVLAMKNWLWGIIGASIVGFQVLMIFISENAFKQKQKWAWYACWAGLLSWFLIDSSITLFYGAIHNMYMINLLALVLIGLPLVFSRKYFFSGNN